MRRRRPDLRLARDSDRDLPVVHPHRQMRHQRALDVPHHLLRRELRRRQNMNLLDRATLALYDLCGDNSRKREDQLLSTLDREYAAGDVVQIQSFFCGDLMLWLETGGQYCRRLSVKQAKIPYSSLQARKRITAEHSTIFQGKRDAFFVSPRCSFHFTATVAIAARPPQLPELMDQAKSGRTH